VTHKVGGADRKRVVYGWSGGMDSIALRVITERAGAYRAVLGAIPHLAWRRYFT
jgi:NH3-dependent NAD+ synthetase